MIKSKSLSGMMVVVVIFAMAAIDYAAAGEKVKSRATSVRTKWHSIEIGDEGGHTIAVFENKNVYVNEKTGEKSTGILLPYRFHKYS